MDNNGYPTQQEIDTIENWHGTAMGLAEYIMERWYYPDYIHIRRRKDPKLVLTMATGGWSGNEDIIRALEGSMFWAVRWIKSERGGYYEFELDDDFEADWGKIIKEGKK